MLSETLDERLSNWFDSNHYERSCTKFVVKESELELACFLENDSLKFHLESENSLTYLKKRTVADAVIFEFIEPQKIRLHIIECKTTVSVKTWMHIIRQFEGALLNALGVMGVLNIPESGIEDIVCYTAYRKDRISPDKVQPTILRDYRNRIHEWEKGRFSILSIPQVFHKKNQLNSSGRGTAHLYHSTPQANSKIDKIRTF